MWTHYCEEGLLLDGLHLPGQYENPTDGCFYYLRNSFCESAPGHYGHIEFTTNGHKGIFEPVNTVSNLFLMVAAIYCLYGCSHRISILNSATLFSVGVGSAIYHATNWDGFSILDNMQTNMFILILGVSIACSVLQKSKLVTFIFLLLGALFIGYITILVNTRLEMHIDDVIDGRIIYGDKKYMLFDSSAFVLPLAFTILALCVATFLKTPPYTGKDAYRIEWNNFDSWKDGRRIAFYYKYWRLNIVAVISFIAAFVAHDIDYSKCSNVTQWMFPHAIWHILVAYASTCAIFQNDNLWQQEQLVDKMYPFLPNLRWIILITVVYFSLYTVVLTTVHT